MTDDNNENGFLNWRTHANRLQGFVSDPKTKKYAEAGSKLLNVASQLGQAKLNGPMSVAGAAIGIIHVVTNASNNSSYSEIIRGAAKRGLRATESNGAISLLFDGGHFEHGEPLVKTQDHSMIALEIEEGKQVAVILDKEGKMVPWFDAYVSPDVTTAQLAKLLWANLGNAVTLTFGMNDFGRETLMAAPIDDFGANEYIGPNSPKDFMKKVRKYEEAGLQRAYLGIGPPGTGKTTFWFKCAEEKGGRIMVLTPMLLNNESVQQSEIVELVRTFRPSVLLLEDVDRVSNSGLLLSLMDFIRKESPDTLVVSTANHPENIVPAMKRPGRLGPTVEFPAPDSEWRKKVLQLYCDKIGIDRDLTHLSGLMDHEQFSHDYIKEVCEQALVEDDDELEAYIKRTVKGFGGSGGSDDCLASGESGEASVPGSKSKRLASPKAVIG